MALTPTSTPVAQALDNLQPETRRKCLHCLYRICDRQALLPRSPQIPLCYDPTEDPLHHGRLADVWKGKYHGRDVVAKVLKSRSRDDLGQIRRVGFSWYSRLAACINNWPCLAEVLQGGCGVESAQSSEHTAAVRRDDDRGSARGGIGVDGEGQHHGVCEGGCQRGSVGARAFLPKVYFRLSLTVIWLL